MNATSWAKPGLHATVPNIAAVLPAQSESLEWIDWAGEIAGRMAEVARSRGSRNAVANACAVIEWEEEERRLHDAEAEAWRAVWRALCLAPSLEIFEALLQGETVPLSRLDREWVRRFGRRR